MSTEPARRKGGRPPKLHGPKVPYEEVDRLLVEGGFLTVRKESPPGQLPVDAGTRAFAMDPGRIYVHLEGKYPRGAVPASEYDHVVQQLRAYFEGLAKDGKPLVRHIYHKSEIYDGPLLEAAPDLVLVGNAGFNLKANMKGAEVFSCDIFTGKHTLEDAFLLTYHWPDDRVPEAPTVEDVFGILQRARSA